MKLKTVKKLVAMVLTCAMGAALLAGCGSSTKKSEGGDAASTGGSSAETEAPASADVAAQTFTFTTTYSETEYAGDIIKELKSQLETLSGGKLTLDVYYGGTMAGTGEELSFVGDGGVDMSLIGQSQYIDVLSLLNFPSQVTTGYADSVKLLDDIAFNNEVTKDLVQAEIEKSNVTMLGSMPGGTNAFITKEEYTSLAEMKNLKLGIGMNQSAMEALGFNVVSVMPWDYYDSLSRAIVDAGYMSVTGLVSMSMQEVTPYFLADGTYTAGNFVTMNLDKWNSLDETTQGILKQAVANTQEYACGRAAELDENAAEKINGSGGKLNTVNAEDAATIQSTFFAYGVSDARAYAEAAGTTDAMETVLQEVAKVVGLEVPTK